MFRRLSLGNISVPLAVAALILISTLVEPRFFTWSNMLSVSQQIAPLAIVTVGQAIALISGGFDLSVGSIIGFAGVMAAYGTVWGGPWAGLLSGILAGTMLGAVNGFVISKFNISPFVVTLGMFTAARGLALLVSGGLTVYNLPPSFSMFGREVWLGFLPVSVIIAAISCLIGWFLLNRLKQGSHFYAIGGNEQAAFLAGISVKKVKFMAYTLSGFFAGLAAVVLTARAGAGQPNAGVNFEMNSIAAAIIGGVLLGGGAGKISQVVWGVILIGTLANSLNLIGLSSYVQLIVTGSVIVIAVILDQMRKTKNN
jgi:ribose/xylose/arabinose/galactoside ABC-type transport system permease subunit